MNDNGNGENDDTTTVGNPSSFLNLSRSAGLGGGAAGGGAEVAGGVSELEQDVLDEYVRLAGNMKTLNTTLQSLASGSITTEIGEGLRQLEKKVASVYTLMKASVYSIVLQQGQVEGDVLQQVEAEGQGSADG